MRERDGAYHQGTVWAWLLGHYALAEYRVTGDRQAALSQLEPTRSICRRLSSPGLVVACVLEAGWKLSKMDPRFLSEP